MRWQREAEYFDAEEYSRGEIPQAVVKRYMELRHPWLAQEFRLKVLGDVTGQRILELGCGDGGNAILLGLKGAHVVGIDVSPHAIEIATERARLHGVGDRVRFECKPLELFVHTQQDQYDIICGFAVLHHVLPVLDSVLMHLKKLAHRDTRFLFAEPASVWRWVRQARLLLPIRVSGTPDERPLNSDDLAIVFKHWPGLKRRYFGTLTRVLNKLFPLFEKMSPLQRGAYHLAARCDAVLLETLALHGLGSYVVLYSPEAEPATHR
jgi:SAM-dependent methyltransferase